MKTSSSIRLVFRFGLQQSPGARYSHCRSQSALGISQLRARPLRSHHQHHLLPRHHQHHLPPSLSLYRAQPVAITRPLRKPASGPTSIRYNLHPRPIRASAKSPTPTLSLHRKLPTGTITCTVGVCEEKRSSTTRQVSHHTLVIFEAVAGRTPWTFLRHLGRPILTTFVSSRSRAAIIDIRVQGALTNHRELRHPVY